MCFWIHSPFCKKNLMSLSLKSDYEEIKMSLLTCKHSILYFNNLVDQILNSIFNSYKQHW